MPGVGDFIQTANLAISIVIVVFTVRVYQGTSDGDPLEKFDRTHINITNNAFEETGTRLLSDLDKFCQCGEEILNNICTEEQIISGCYDISSNRNKNLLRNLKFDCDSLPKDVDPKHPNYHEVFELKFDMVNKMALGILIIYVAILGIVVVSLFLTCGLLCCPDCVAVIMIPITIIIFLVVIGGGIADLVLLIIMMVNYYKGTTTGEFLDYYANCLATEYKKGDLKQVYLDLDDIDYNMTVLVVTNFVGMFLNYLGSCLTKKKEEGN